MRKEIKVLFFYGCYFISNPITEEYLMIDIPNQKLRPIDNECFQIMELLQELKNDIKEYVQRSD